MGTKNHSEIEKFDLPHNFSKEELAALLIHGYRLNASDITLQTEQPVWAEVYGNLVHLTSRVLLDYEIRSAATMLYGDNATTNIAGGGDIDTDFWVQVDRAVRIGFRVNITGGLAGKSDGIQITMRSIPGVPPTLEELNVEPEIAEAINPLHGMVLVAGKTGSGKSTTLAAGIRQKLESIPNRKIITYEAPIEFRYDGIKTANSSFIFQTEIPKHLQHESGFAYGVRNALRRAPKDILVGEARDRETIEALIEASLTGHVTYGTVHSDSIGNTISRMVMKFPEDSRDGVAYDLISVLHLIVVQELVQSLDGRRVALREYFVFDRESKKKLLAAKPIDIPRVLQRMVEELGHTLKDAAKRAYDAGLIAEEILMKFQKEAA